MCYEGEILFAAPLHFHGLLCGKGLHCQTNCLVENVVENMEGLSLQTQTMGIGEIVETAAQDVVLANDLLDIEAILDPLQTMGWRATFAERF